MLSVLADLATGETHFGRRSAFDSNRTVLHRLVRRECLGSSRTSSNVRTVAKQHEWNGAEYGCDASDDSRRYTRLQIHCGGHKVRIS